MPQLNPEFFISQLFWLILTFSFLLIFMWRISLPRISSVLQRREDKIENDLATAKQLQTEAEKIQKDVDNQLRQAKLETTELIKTASSNFQNQTTNKLDQLNEKLTKKLDESAKIIEKNKTDSLKLINDQIYAITKLTLSKISNIETDDKEIKVAVDDIQSKIIN